MDVATAKRWAKLNSQALPLQLAKSLKVGVSHQPLLAPASVSASPWGFLVEEQTAVLVVAAILAVAVLATSVLG